MSFIKKYWLGICSVLAIAIFGFVLYGSLVGNHMYPFKGMAYTTGRAIVYAIISFFVVNFLRKRWERTRLEFGIYCFAASFCLCATNDLIKINTLVNQLNNSKQEMARLAEDVDKVPSQKSVNEYSEEQYGDFSKILSLLKHSLESSEDIAAEMIEARANLEDILTPENLSDREKIFKLKKQIAIFSDKLDRFKKRYVEEMNRREIEIKKAFSGNEEMKGYVLRGFEKGKKVSNKLMKEYFHIEKETVQKITETLDFLSEKSGPFWVSGETIIFEKDEDLDIFNQLAQNMVDLGQKEVAIIEKLEMHKQSVLQDMKN